MKLIIGGGHDWLNYNLCEKEIKLFFSEHGKAREIVCNGSKGAAQLGELFARRNMIHVKRFLEKHPEEPHKGVRGETTFKTHIEMTKYADALLVMWNGKSLTASHLISFAVFNKLIIKVVMYDQ